jgi:hypothetical protein
MKIFVCALAAFAAAAAMPAAADDSSAALGAGGLVFVEATPDVRAVQDGRDITAQVRAAGLPLNIVGRGLVEAIDKMPAAERKRLAKQGLLEMDGSDAHPRWIAKTRYWWRQRFPAGKTVAIAHRYQPVTGQFFFGAGDLALKDPDYTREYCIDAATAAAVRGRTAKLDPQAAQYLQGFRTEFAPARDIKLLVLQ